jgi:hypothetical protein
MTTMKPVQEEPREVGEGEGEGEVRRRSRCKELVYYAEKQEMDVWGSL